MKRGVLLLAVVFVLANVFSSAALASGRLGPPTADLKTNQVGVGFDYVHGEIDFDVDWSSDYASDIPKSKAKDMKSDVFLIRFAGGLSDSWEIFGFLGAADLRGKMNIVNIETVNFDTGHNFNGGLGTKYTFLQDGKLSGGILFQVSWGQGYDGYIVDLSGYGGPSSVDIDAEADWYDIFLVAGPTYDMGKLRIYGGAGLYYFDADLEVRYMDITVVEGSVEESLFGGYGGVEFEIDAKCSLYGEYMVAADAWAFGTGIGWKL